MTADKALIQIEDVFKTYHLGEVDVPVLKGVSFNIKQGEMVALMGVSGSGKSTLMNILGLLDRPTTGKYWLNGQEVSRLSAEKRATVRNRNIGFVFQSFNLLARTTALDNVRMPLVYSVKQWSNRDERKRAMDILGRVGLAERYHHEPSQLSGGQQQRVAISRALVNYPPILLADEPTGNLDSRTSEEILAMFQRLNRDDGITVILVTHDFNVARHANRIIYIRDGLIDNEALAKLAAESAGGHGHGTLSSVSTNGNGHAVDGNGSTTNGSTGGGGNAPAFAVAGAPALTADGTAMSSAAAAIAVAQEIPQTAVASAAQTAVVPAKAVSAGPPRKAATRIIPRTLGTAFLAIRRNAFRSALTTLGIVIGIAAVIAMMEIGQGSAAAMKQTIASMGANMLTVLPGTASSGGVSFGSGSTITLTPDDADALQRECPAVANASPVVRARTQVVFGNKNWVPMYIYGSTPQFLQIRDWTDMAAGAAFTDSDVRDGSAVCVLGQTVVDNLFGDESPVGKDIRMQGVSFRVLGVLSKKGSNMLGMDQDDLVLAPWTTVKFRVSGSSMASVNQANGTSASSSSDPTAQAAAQASSVNTLNQLYPNIATTPYPGTSTAEAADTPQPIRRVNVDQIMVQADTTEDIPLAIEQITEVLHERHHIGDGQPDDFSVRDMTEMTNTLSSTSRLMSGLLLAVAFISLVVGGVGIMNIMLVSVTERTREIGLRMAVGARPNDILMQFITEAVMLCMFGGIIGITLGRGGSMLVRKFLHWPTQISIIAILLAVAVSVTVGLVFGFYPAWKASRLDPIDALRYE
jgi:ABC-type lipoprotein export system ATPase subunit/ABC-type antimicrobial peptide transport system permease subunit